MNLLIRWAMSESAIYLLKYMAGLAIAVQVDFDRIHPDAKISKWTGVTQAWDMSHNRERDLPPPIDYSQATATTGWRGQSDRSQWVQYEPPFQFIPVRTDWEYATGPGFSYSNGAMGGSPGAY